MPSLRLLGIPTSLASDDFVGIGVALGILHATWVGLIAAFLESVAGCSDSDTRFSFAVAALVVHLLNVASELWLAWESDRGPPMEPSQRHRVRPIIYGRGTLFWGDFGVTLWGTAEAVQMGGGECVNTASEVALRVIMIGNWLMITLFILFTSFCTFSRPVAASGQSLWETLCVLMTKAADKNIQRAQARSVVSNMSSAILALFPSSVDLTLTDYLCGLFILNAEKRALRHSDAASALHDRDHGVVRAANGDECPLDSSLPALRDCAAMSKYSLAPYGWVLYAFSYPGRCCEACGRRHKAAELFTYRDGEELFSQHPEGGLESIIDLGTPDHIVVAFRGTLSVADILRDFDYEAAPLTSEELAGVDVPEAHAHRGMLDAARENFAHLQSLPEFVAKAEAGARVDFVGHSLGAGVAALIATFARAKGWDAHARCYGVPGATMTSELAEESKGYCLSAFLNADFVTRLSPSNVEHLRAEIVSALSRCKVSKFNALTRFALPCFSTNRLDSFVSAVEAVGEAAELRDIALDQLERSPLKRGSHVLWAPGNLLRLLKLPNSEGHWPRWEQREAREEYGIDASASIFADHLPNRLHQALQRTVSLAEQKVVSARDASDGSASNDSLFPRQLPV